MIESQDQQHAIAPSTDQNAVPEPVRRGQDDSVIDLRYLFVVWLKWIWVPVLMGGVGMYLGSRDLQNFTPLYVASMTIEPTGGTSGASPIEVGGLAAQFGIQVRPVTNSVSSFQRLTMMIGSYEFAEQLEANHGMLEVLFGGSWDEATQTWAKPLGKDFERDQARRAFFRKNLWSPPNLETVAGYVEVALVFDEINNGPFWEVSVSHADPEFALWLLTTAYFEADELLRQRDKAESAISQANIKAKLSVETNVQFQEALRGLLVTELSREIMLDEGLPYAARIIEPARVGNRLTEPNLQTTLGVPVVAFSGFGFLLTTLIAVFRRERIKP